jgi:hypothetical protein
MADIFAKKFKSGMFKLIYPRETREAKAAEEEVLRPPEFPQMMAEDGGWRYEFETWARNHGRGEVVNVLRDIKAYQAQQSLAALQHIVNTYFDPTLNSIQYVTIDDDNITQALIYARDHPPNPLPPDLFDDAYGAVWNNNAPDTYRVFLEHRND